MRNWLRAVANKKTRISIRHVGIYVQFKAEQTERLYHSRHDKVQLKLLLQKQLSTKATQQLMRFLRRTETMVLPDHKLWQ